MKYLVTLLVTLGVWMLLAVSVGAQSAQKTAMSTTPQKLMQLQANALKMSQIATAVRDCKPVVQTADRDCGCCMVGGPGGYRACGCQLCGLERPQRTPGDISITNLELMERPR